jgi:hypothetical protein
MLDQAISKLKALDFDIEPSDIPGLIFVGDRELTQNQVIDFANQLVDVDAISEEREDNA